MKILRVLSLLLDYPTQQLIDAKVEIKQLIDQADDLSEVAKQSLHIFIDQRFSMNVMDWQSEYDGLFERGRSLGLWLFEHVHGESRDRGQAMVDLMNEYQKAGLEIDQAELPDYIPLFLEFLSTQGEQNAQSWLQEVEHILAVLLCRLEKRESDYVVLFETLLMIADSNVTLDDIRQEVHQETRDDTKQALDEEWEEEMVTFGSPDTSCPSGQNRPSESQRRDTIIPVTWKDFNHQPKSQAVNVK